MGRPRKEYRLKRNGDSLQVYDRAGFVGSISLFELTRYLRVRSGTDRVYKETGVKDV